MAIEIIPGNVVNYLQTLSIFKIIIKIWKDDIANELNNPLIIPNK